MRSLQSFADASWSLEDFVQVVNALSEQFLPQFLPQEKPDKRIKDNVNPRLIRHYTSLGMLDAPDKVGKEARYKYRHLLQILVLRRLLTQGYTAITIGSFTVQRNDNELVELLQGGTQMTDMPASPGLAFLETVKTRTSSPPTTDMPANPGLAFLEQVKTRTPSPSTTEPKPQSGPIADSVPKTWVRLEILPGLELHVRDDFQFPTSAQEHQNLMELMQRLLSTTATKRSPYS